VLARGFEESIVPLKHGEALRGAFAIESFEKLALRIVALELRVRAGGNKKQKYCGKEKLQIPDGRGKLICRRGEEKSEISHARRKIIRERGQR